MQQNHGWDEYNHNNNGDGGGTGGGGGYYHPGTAQHMQFGRMLVALSEGEISGLVNGLKSVYLDGTPIQNADGTFNFRGLSVGHTKGTIAQGVIPGFDTDESESVVNVKVVKATPVVRTISTSGLSAIRVKIGIPCLGVINTSNGSKSAATVQVKIERQSVNWNGGAWENVPLEQNGTIQDRFDSRALFGYRVDLPAAGPWSIRVTRLTNDAPDQYTQNETWWDGYTEIVDSRLSRPCTSLLALYVNAKQFPSLPQVHSECYGVLVDVPKNYDPIARTYATSGEGTTGGAWDGTFKRAWTNNPAWLFHHIATEPRYGAGEYLSASQIDKYALYQIGRMCDELVPNGKGGTEPRFTLSVHIQAQEDAIKVLWNLAAAFRGMVYGSGGGIVPVQDVDSPVAAIFTKANVINGEFRYTGTAKSARHTAALVSWLDPEAGYSKALEYVEAPDAIAQYGLNVANVEGFGITSQAQAQRLGRWMLLTEDMRRETVTFRAALDASLVRLGDVVRVSDHDRLKAPRLGGRVVTATTTSVTLDAPVTVEAGMTLQCRLASGAVETRSVTNQPGAASTLTVSPAFSTAPQPESVWIIPKATGGLYRVVGLGEAGPLEYEITAIEHNPAIYSDTVDITQPGWKAKGIAAAPSVTLAPYTRTYNNAIAPVLAGAWPNLQDATGYEAAYSLDFGPWIPVQVNSSSFEIVNASPGYYRVRVRAVYGLKPGPYVVTTVTIGDPATLPPNLNQVKNDAAADATSKANAAQQAAVSAAAADAKAKADAALASAIADATTRVNGAISQAATDAQAKANAAKAAAVSEINAAVAGMVSGATSAADAVGKVQTAAQNAASAASTAQSTANTASSAASAAQSAASTAQTSANNAQASANAAQTMPVFAAPANLPSLPNAAYPAKFGPVLTSSDWSLWKVNAAGSAWERILFASTGIFGKLTVDQLNVTAEMQAAIASIAFLKTQMLTVITDASASGPGGTVQIGSGAIKAGSILAQHMVLAGDNLIPNPNSEQPTPSGGWPDGAFEGIGVTTASPYQGTRCRWLPAGIWHMSPMAPCAVGDSYVFRCMIKSYFDGCSAAEIAIRFYDASGAYLSGGIGVPNIYRPTWTLLSTTGIVPPGAAFVDFCVYTSVGGVYVDNMFAGLMVDASLIVDGSIEGRHIKGQKISTSNYTEDTYGNPVAGAQMSLGTVPLKIGEGGAQFCGTILDEPLIRTMTLLASTPKTASEYVGFLKGNNDQGGKPNTACANVIPRYVRCDGWTAEWSLNIQPTALSDNLDALIDVEVEFYVYGEATPREVRTYALPFGRRYADLTAHSAVANSCGITFNLHCRNGFGNVGSDAATWAPNCYLRLRLRGIRGTGDWLWYSPATRGTTITGSATTPWTNAPAGGVGGGGGAGGGDIGCVPAWTPLQLEALPQARVRWAAWALGRVLRGRPVRRSGSWLCPVQWVREGDVSAAWDDQTLERIPGGAVVLKTISYPDRDIWDLETEHGRQEASHDHRIYCAGEDWPALRTFEARQETLWEVGGQLVPSRILGAKPTGRRATVYHLSQAHGHIYATNGLPAHNAYSSSLDTAPQLK